VNDWYPVPWAELYPGVEIRPELAAELIGVFDAFPDLTLKQAYNVAVRRMELRGTV
jgi:hypothetical protein